MEPQGHDASFELLKYILVLASMPLWVPFAKALWDEFLLALRPDGGLSGHELTRRERSEIEQDISLNEDLTQVHEPIAHLRGQGPARGNQKQTGRSFQPAMKRAPGPQAGSQRRAFVRRSEGPSTPDGRPRFR